MPMKEVAAIHRDSQTSMAMIVNNGQRPLTCPVCDQTVRPGSIHQCAAEAR